MSRQYKPMPKLPGDLAERFWAKADMSGEGCWNYLGAPSQTYPAVKIKGVKIKAHRIAYALTRGELVPEDRLICHHCDNPRCVRPDHLFIGTSSDNQLDSVRKGRNGGCPAEKRARGERAGRRLHPERFAHLPRLLAKLTDEQAEEIRKARIAGANVGDLAAQYGVCRSTIRSIIRRKQTKVYR